MSQTPTNTLSNMGLDFTPTLHHDTYPHISPTSFSIDPVPPGRSVFITGASKGIGAATALAFARAGFSRIAVGARSPSLAHLVPEIKDAARKAGRAEPRVLVVEVDVTKRESVEEAVERVRGELLGGGDGDGEDGDGDGGRGRRREKGGRLLDVVVANAGFLESFVPAAEVEDVDEWWRSYEVNVLGTFLTYRYFAPLLLGPASSSSSSSSADAQNSATASTDGRKDEHTAAAADDASLKTFLILSSIGAHNQGGVGGSAYRSTKLALLRFAERIAYEEERRGLQVISVHPGGVPTELAWRMGEELGRKVLVDTPELAADTIVWLTRERRGWLNARYVSCNWDMGELEGKREEVVRGDLLKVRMAVEVGN